jgi:hypothetical protein
VTSDAACSATGGTAIGRGGAHSQVPIAAMQRFHYALDTVIALRRPKDYSPEQGARFEIHFEKLRN